VISGTGLGPAQEVGASLTSSGNLATSLAGTQVTFDGIPAPLISVRAQKIVCVVPFELADVYATVVQVESNGSQSNSIRVPVTPTAVQILGVVNDDGTPNSPDHPAQSQSTMTIYAAGFGQTRLPGVDGVIGAASATPVAPVGVWFTAPLAAQLLYVGPAPGMVAGISQINVRVPQLPPGSYRLFVGTGTSIADDYDFTTVTLK
jgi:uncharacterized protein (TIGR03437 family)